MKEYNSIVGLKLLPETILGWQGFFSHIQPECKIQAHKIANHIQRIIGKILAVIPSETSQNLLMSESLRLDELFAERQL